MASEDLETDIINCLISGLVSVLSYNLGSISNWEPPVPGSVNLCIFLSPLVPFSFEMKPT